jgi:hypothetical protein
MREELIQSVKKKILHYLELRKYRLNSITEIVLHEMNEVTIFGTKKSFNLVLFL